MLPPRPEVCSRRPARSIYGSVAPTCSLRRQAAVRRALQSARAALDAILHGCARADLFAAGPQRATRSRARDRLSRCGASLPCVSPFKSARAALAAILHGCGRSDLLAAATEGHALGARERANFSCASP